MLKRKFSKKKVLVICDYRPTTAGTIIEHIKAFSLHSNHDVEELNSLGDIPLYIDLNDYDVVAIHYSIAMCIDYFLSKSARKQIREFSGIKVAYIQDDYRWIFRTLAAIEYMKIDVIFGLASQNIVDEVYRADLIPSTIKRETTLAGYVSPTMLNDDKPSFENRLIDVGYRARKVPSWIGEHTLQKWMIADRFLEDAKNYPLKCNISYREEDRIYGQAWSNFLSSCKAVLGTESGASVCDFTGEIQKNVELHLTKDPNASFETLRKLYFADIDGKIMMNVISPRCFEAISVGTLLILYEGEYSNVLEPYRHYVPLARDHSNMDEIVEYLQNKSKWEKITTTAYQEIISHNNYHFSSMVKDFDDVLKNLYHNNFLLRLPNKNVIHSKYYKYLKHTVKKLPFRILQSVIFIKKLPVRVCRKSLKILRTSTANAFYNIKYFISITGIKPFIYKKNKSYFSIIRSYKAFLHNFISTTGIKPFIYKKLKYWFSIIKICKTFLHNFISDIKHFIYKRIKYCYSIIKNCKDFLYNKIKYICEIIGIKPFISKGITVLKSIGYFAYFLSQSFKFLFNTVGIKINKQLNKLMLSLLVHILHLRFFSLGRQYLDAVVALPIPTVKKLRLSIKLIQLIKNIKLSEANDYSTLLKFEEQTSTLSIYFSPYPVCQELKESYYRSFSNSMDQDLTIKHFYIKYDLWDVAPLHYHRPFYLGDFSDLCPLLNSNPEYLNILLSKTKIKREERIFFKKAV